MIIFNVKGHSPVGPTFNASRLLRNPRSSPTRAIAAPAYPPINACDELVGRPSHHVIRSHTIAPTRPAIITYGVTSWRSTKPLPIVLATAVPKINAAAKLKNAAQSTAWQAVSTRVATIVAIELAAS